MIRLIRLIRLIRVSLLLFIALFSSEKLRAQASPRVPLSDAVYSQLDQIVGSGVLRSVLYGQRPYRRTEIARLVAEASEQVTVRPISTSTERILKQLKLRFARELRAIQSAEFSSATIHETSRDASVEFLVLNSPARAIESAPTGGIAADFNSLLNNREGQRFAQSTSNAATTTATFNDAWSFGQHISTQLTPRIAAGSGVSNFAELSLQRASVDLSAFNLQLSIGRQQRVWGQGLEGGMLLSSSGRPLDMVSIETDRPFHLPHPLKWAGLLRATVFVADLGARQNFPHAKIAAYKVNSRLNSFLELGVAMMVQQGGSGAPPASFTDHFFDFFPLRNDRRANPPQFSNKIGAFDARANSTAAQRAGLCRK